MKNKRIFLSSPHMSDEGYEKEYIKEAFDTNWIAPLGKNVDNFEKEFSALTGAKYSVALSSGTSAIHLSLILSGIGNGDRVFCQSLTFSASANPIIYQGGIPVFIDSDEKTWNMCPNHLEKAFQKYPDIKAVILVHLYGIPTDTDKIKEICDKYGAFLIEDAAESLGAMYKGEQTGIKGKFGIFSFNGNKIITTSGGGMLVSDDKELIERARFFATQSRDKALHYQHSEIGYNYRLSNVLAGIGRGQLKVLKKRVQKKRYIYNYYKENLNDLKGVSFMPENEFSNPNYWLSVILLNDKVRPLDIITTLEKENIESRPVWKPMHIQPVFEKYDYVGENVAEELFENGVCLPSDTKMTDSDLERVCRLIKNLWK